MYHPFITGENIYLRGIEKSDLEINKNYFQWFNDSEITKYLNVGAFPNTEEDMKNFYNNIVLSKNNVIFAIIDIKTKKHIGNIKIGPIDWISRITPMSLIIGNKNYWNKGVGYESINLILNYSFNTLNLCQVYLGVVSTHTTAIKLYQKAGFDIIGSIEKHVLFEGKYTDTTYMGIFKKKFNEMENNV